MDKLWELIWQQVGSQWLAFTLVAGAFIYFLLPIFLKERRAEQHRSDEIQENFVDNLQKENAALRGEVDRVRRLRSEDADDNESELQRWRGRLDLMQQNLDARDATIRTQAGTVSSMEKNATRLRHQLAAAWQWIAAARDLIRATGGTPPPYNGWREMASVDPQIGAVAAELFGGDEA